ncbi:MAG TPA: carboxyl transferase domain-containing protein [Thermoanaerobaculia bacterium]|nr:carboxyl transferase domain-containing protein [Thermoanaerobaculia bacterium]
MKDRMDLSNPGIRRLEAPVLVDRRGTVWAPGLIDVSLRHQDRSVVAESPPPGLPEKLDRTVREAAVRFAGAKGKAGAFTVSFLADPASGEHRLLGTAPGLPESAAVIEFLDELDLPALEVHISRGGTLDGKIPEARGHALQVRLSALDPEDGFVPRPGVVESLRLPAGAGLRADAAVEEGAAPGGPVHAIALITAHGRTRAEALARLQRGLAHTEAAVRGGTTDKAFLTEILDRPELSNGGGEPGWIERLIASGEHLPHRGSEAALLAAAVAGYEAENGFARARFYESAARGRPEVPKEIGRNVELRYRGQTYLFRVSRLGADLFRIEIDGLGLDVRAGAPGRTGRTFSRGERSWRVSLAEQGNRLLVEVDGIPHHVERDAGGIVRSPVPAVVSSLAVQEGDEVAAGDPLVVLEAMKLETTLYAPAPGRVRKVLARRNAQVGTGGPLLMLEPVTRAGSPASDGGRRVRFEALDETAGGPRQAGSLEEVRLLMLGYDVDPRTAERIATEARAGSLAVKDEILCAYVDISSLFRRQPGDSLEDGGRHSSEEYLFTYLRNLDARGAGLPESFLDKLRRALAHYGVGSLERSPELEESLFRVAISHGRLSQQAAPVLALLERLLDRNDVSQREGFRELLDRLISETQGYEPAVHDLAREVRYRAFDRPVLLAARESLYATAEADLALLAADPAPEERARLIRALVECAQPFHRILSQRYESAGTDLQEALLEVMVRRYYRIRELRSVSMSRLDGQVFASAEYDWQGSHVHLIATHAERGRMAATMETVRRLAAAPAPGTEIVADLYFWSDGPPPGEDAIATEVAALLESAEYPSDLQRVAVTLSGPDSHFNITFRRSREEGGAFREDRVYRGIHPMVAQRLQLWRLQNFQLERLPSPEAVYFFRGVAHENPRDERLFAIAEVRDLTPVRDELGRVVHLPQLERMLMEALAGIRRVQSRRAPGERLQWNRVLLYVWPPVELLPDEIRGLVRRLAPLTEGLGLEKVAVRCRIPDPQTGELRDWVMEISNPGEGGGRVLRFRRPKEAPNKPLREYAQKVVDLRRRGLVHPFELVKMIAPSARDAQFDLPPGDFVEHDLDEAGNALVPVDRPYGGNTAGIVAGVVRNFTARHPEGMSRVLLLGDPSHGMGALGEPECRRILAALELARRMGVPLEWFSFSAGARIAMDSGTENMDWIGRVLRRIVEFTQAGGEINLVVAAVNVGAQSYWNAEATILMHTRGILIMTPEGSMVLTGKQALDYSGGVSAEDNRGIGGYERIMGPNGQAQYFAKDLGEACRTLLRHYEHAYVAPGERFPRPAPTGDPKTRDVRDSPHGGEFQTVGEVFSPIHNPGRKKPFEIRKVMASVVDQDHEPLERWYGMRDAEIGVVWDAHLGGQPVSLLGFESKPLPRLGWVPVYGPDHFTGGTLFPLSAKKIARAINAASGNRPLVILANLSGFDGSPESMRNWQLEYGAEIGRAVVNFKGPIVFCVISRYHGGAFVVFSNALNDNMEVAALEGTYASVIGGAPAAAVVFAREVRQRTRKDPRILELEKSIADPERMDKARLRAQLEEMIATVRSEKLGEVAEEFDAIHSIQRAREVGSVHRIIAPAELRPYLIDAVERGMAKELGGFDNRT